MKRNRGLGRLPKAGKGKAVAEARAKPKKSFLSQVLEGRVKPSVERKQRGPV